jgi:uncharacterized protein GlcG (DUF336 family)
VTYSANGDGAALGDVIRRAAVRIERAPVNGGQPTRAVDLRAAQAVIDAARAKAERIGVPVNIAVVDAGSSLVAFVRLDGAWLGSIEIAQAKAHTARAFDMATRELGRLAQPGEPLHGIETSDHVLSPGGIPLTTGESVVGAIGVSGGSVEQDHEVAAAGAAGFRSGS